MVTATGIVADVQMDFPGGVVADLSYFITFHGTVSNGLVTAPFGTTSPNYIGPFVVLASTQIHKIDKLIRQAMADACLAEAGFVIDPNDIYIPFS